MKATQDLAPSLIENTFHVLKNSEKKKKKKKTLS